MWRGPLSHGAYVVVVLNRFNEEKQIILDWAKDATLPISENMEENVFILQDLWSGDYLSNVTIGESKWDGNLMAHQNWAFKLIPTITYS